MKKKGISICLSLLLVAATFVPAFAGTATDVAGTSFEKAVNALTESGVVSGYPDGTFRPEASITRAEACVIVVKSMGATEEGLKAAKASGFQDLSGYDWAAKYVNYAVSKGVVSGYPNGTFQPGNEVTYNEMAAMLVMAMGYKASDLSGSWPTNFSDKAKEVGMLAGVPFKGSSPALRGYVAMMDYSVAAKITEANKTGTPTVPEEEAEDPAGRLAGYSGRAYGVILDTATVKNSDGDSVQQIEFLIGDDTVFVEAKEDNTYNTAGLAASLTAGDLFGLRMSYGVVKTVDTSAALFAAIGSPTGYQDLNPVANTWAAVTAENNSVVTVAGPKTVTILDGASIYVAEVEGGVITGYEPGSLSDLEVGCDVRLYSITGDEPGIAEVVFIKE